MFNLEKGFLFVCLLGTSKILPIYLINEPDLDFLAAGLCHIFPGTILESLRLECKNILAPLAGYPLYPMMISVQLQKIKDAAWACYSNSQEGLARKQTRSAIEKVELQVKNLLLINATDEQREEFKQIHQRLTDERARLKDKQDLL